MKCPGCGNATASTVLLCLKCGWQAPDAAETMAPPAPPPGLTPRATQGGILFMIGLLVLLGCYVTSLALEGAPSVVLVVAACGLGLTLAGLYQHWRGLREPTPRPPFGGDEPALGELDLSVHRGSAVFGRTVRLHEATYRVERLPGAVLGVTPHVLVNERTSLALLRARFHPDGGAGPADPKAWTAAVPGGRVTLTTHDGPFEAAAPWSDLLDRARDAHLQGDLARDEALTRRLLEVNSTHVLALNHLAGVLVAREKYAEAVDVALDVIVLEPNHPGFAINLARLLSTFSPGAALDIYRLGRARFPAGEELDELGVRLLLEVGAAREALEILDARPRESMSALRAEALLLRSSEDLAAPLLTEAIALVQRRESEGVLDLLERAHDAHPRDPYTVANLGLALGRAGRNAEAAEALRRAAGRLPRPLDRFCLANAAFALFDDGHPADAATLLAQGLGDLLDGPGAAEVALADLPSVGLFVFPPGGSAEGTPERALEILEHLDEALRPATPPTIRRLVELYRRAVEARTAN